MGRFKNESTDNPIYNWLVKQGYKEGTGACGEKGLVKTYSVDNDFYYVWVTINLTEKKVYVYKEYNCGGCVGETEINIQDEWLKDLKFFIDEMDMILESWIG